MTRAAVAWIEAGLSRRLAMLGTTRLIVRAEPGAVMWRADVRLRGARRPWTTWRRTERAAKAACVALARALAKGRG